MQQSFTHRLTLRGDDRRQAQPAELISGSDRARVVVVLEGAHDIAFLTQLSGLLHLHHAEIPDLAELESAGRLIFIPVGGSNFRYWTDRLEHLQVFELHLYDREVPPLTAEREVAIAAVNRRRRCFAQLTRKRSLENYLDSSAIRECSGIELQVTDEMDIPDAVARSLFERTAWNAWPDLPARARRRLRNSAKQWLNREAVGHMTPRRLARRDPAGELTSWLLRVGRLAGPMGQPPPGF